MIVELTTTNVEIIPELNAVNLVITPTFTSGTGGGSDVTKTYVDYQDSLKVDKVDGKVLSTNDFTDILETKLNGIETGAQVNAANTVVDADYVHTENNFTNADVLEVAKIANKVDKVTGKSLIDDTEIAKLADYPTLLTETTNKVISDTGELVTVMQAVGGFANNLYFSNVDNTITGVKVLSYVPDTTPTLLNVPVASGDGDKLAFSFIYPTAVSVTEIPAGLWSFQFWGYVSATAGATFLGVRYWKYSILGVKTYVFPTIIWSKEINNLAAAIGWIPFDPTVQLAITVDPTDRMGCDVFVKTSGVTRTVYFNVGDGNASYLNNPNALRHISLRAPNQDLMVQHVDSTSEKTTPIDADSAIIWDSVAIKAVRTSFANLKAFLKTYFDGIYSKIITQADDATATGTIAILPNTIKVLTTSLTNANTLVITPTAPTVFTVQNEATVVLTVGATAPTLTFTPPAGVTFVWMDKAAPSALTINKTYTVVFFWINATTCQVFHAIKA